MKKENQSLKKLLKAFSEAHGAPSNEEEVRELFLAESKELGSMHSDRLGSLVCRAHISKEAQAKALFLAHFDEVAFMVQSITSDGFIRFSPLGGWWPATLAAQKVSLKNSQGTKHTGVICSMPPHFLNEGQRQKIIPLDKLYIDIGASSKEDVLKNFGIQLGDTIVPDCQFQDFAQGKYFLGKAFDNRVGVTLSAALLKETQNENIDYQLFSGSSVQEEMGLRGARTIGNKIKPDVAFILEGPPADDTPEMPRSECQGMLGQGVQLRFADSSALMNRKLAQYTVDLCKKHNIKHQISVRRSGGTDAGTVQFAEAGVPCMVIGVPTRYIHTHNSIIDPEDLHSALELCLALVKDLNHQKILSF